MAKASLAWVSLTVLLGSLHKVFENAPIPCHVQPLQPKNLGTKTYGGQKSEVAGRGKDMAGNGGICTWKHFMEAPQWKNKCARSEQHCPRICLYIRWFEIVVSGSKLIKAPVPATPVWFSLMFFPFLDLKQKREIEILRRG